MRSSGRRGAWAARTIGLLSVSLVLSGTALTGRPVGAAAVRPSPAAIYAAQASFSGPIAAGTIVEPLSAHPLNLAANGYLEQEYFASGTAFTFKPLSTPASGKWSIAPTTSAFYRTRIIVRRPAAASKFNGTVVVEWMNESAGESAPDWDYLNPTLMQDGYAWVGVSAQALGVSGGTALLGQLGQPKGGLVGQEPARYGSLVHPGDQYALDIYAQIGAALRRPTGGVLGALQPRRVIAAGESQSAFFMTTFADALQTHTHTFDGIFIHSRGGGAAPLNGASIATAGVTNAVRIRTDLTVPVFMFETQTDAVELGYAPAQQPNTRLIRTWEVAGTSHADNYIVGGAAGALGCTTPINTGPQHVVIQAAFTSFNRWVDHGVPPPAPAPFKFTSIKPPVLALDAHGNVIGGVRTPAVDAPVSALSGAAPTGASAVCSLFGQTNAFSAAQLTSLYGSKAHYLAEYQASLHRAIAGGYVLPGDQAALLAQAQAVSVG